MFCSTTALEVRLKNLKKKQLFSKRIYYRKIKLGKWTVILDTTVLAHFNTISTKGDLCL